MEEPEVVMDKSPTPERDLAFVTAWAPEPELVVDINAVEAVEATEPVDNSAESDIVAYLAVLHSEILELKNEVRSLRHVDAG